MAIYIENSKVFSFSMTAVKKTRAFVTDQTIKSHTVSMAEAEFDKKQITLQLCTRSVL
jgi:hypothetical protein